MYWLCDVYDNTANNYKKQNDVIEIIQENKWLTERRVEKKQLIEIKKNRITSSNIIKWLTVIQSKREIKRITKRKSNRLREWKKEKENYSFRDNEDTRRKKNRKQKFIWNMSIEEIKKIKKWRNKEKYKNSWEIGKRDFSRMFIFI